MATVDQCRQALREVAARLAAVPEAGARMTLDRALACHITDLDVHFHGRLRDGQLRDLGDGDDPKAQLRLRVRSDDLVDLVDGRLDIVRAWTTGRLALKASVSDLLKLRRLL
jgi:hypothetical protein